MPHFQVALLRGINVGKAKRVAMADLRELVEGLGYGGVRTLLNSGNVVFTTPRAAAGTAGRRIESAIAEKLGVDCRVIVISGTVLAEIVESNPLVAHADNHSRLMAGVLADAVSLSKMKPLLDRDWSPERLAVGDRVVHYWCPKSLLDSPLAAAIARALGDAVTSRNWATMLKLHELTKAE